MGVPRSRLVQLLNEHGIHNDYEILTRFGQKGEINVAITYHTYAPRATRSRCTQVWRPDGVTDRDAPWYNHGNKTFPGGKAETWTQAVEWATKTYAITKWAPSPFGASTYIPERVLSRARAWATKVLKDGVA
jgi:hypothetical protein